MVEVIKGGGEVMSLEDLAECDAEVIKPIKYDYRAGKNGDEGVTLWEVSIHSLSTHDRGIDVHTVSVRRMDRALQH